MSIVYINTGTSINSGDGDSIRTAFTKVNANFSTLDTYIGSTTSSGLQTVIQQTEIQTFVHPNHTGITAAVNTQTNQINLSVKSTLTNLTVTNSFGITSSTFNVSGKTIAITTQNSITVDGFEISGANAISTSNTPPTNATTGTTWYDSESGRTFIRYDNTWVDSFGSLGPIGIRGEVGPKGSEGPTGPSGPSGPLSYAPGRYVIVYSHPLSLAPGEVTVANIATNYKSFVLLSMNRTENTRVRIYGSANLRDNDIDREYGSPYIPETTGILCDVNHPGGISQFCPGLMYSNLDLVDSASIPISITNTSTTEYQEPFIELTILGIEPI